MRKFKDDVDFNDKKFDDLKLVRFAKLTCTVSLINILTAIDEKKLSLINTNISDYINWFLFEIKPVNGKSYDQNGIYPQNKKWANIILENPKNVKEFFNGVFEYTSEIVLRPTKTFNNENIQFVIEKSNIVGNDTTINVQFPYYNIKLNDEDIIKMFEKLVKEGFGITNWSIKNFKIIENTTTRNQNLIQVNAQLKTNNSKIEKKSSTSQIKKTNSKEQDKKILSFDNCTIKEFLYSMQHRVGTPNEFNFINEYESTLKELEQELNLTTNSTNINDRLIDVENAINDIPNNINFKKKFNAFKEQILARDDEIHTHYKTEFEQFNPKLDSVTIVNEESTSTLCYNKIKYNRFKATVNGKTYTINDLDDAAYEETLQIWGSLISIFMIEQLGIDELVNYGNLWTRLGPYISPDDYKFSAIPANKFNEVFIRRNWTDTEILKVNIKLMELSQLKFRANSYNSFCSLIVKPSRNDMVILTSPTDKIYKLTERMTKVTHPLNGVNLETTLGEVSLIVLNDMRNLTNEVMTKESFDRANIVIESSSGNYQLNDDKNGFKGNIPANLRNYIY